MDNQGVFMKISNGIANLLRDGNFLFPGEVLQKIQFILQ